MKPVTGPELCRLIEAHGWQLQRVRGSHHIYSKTGERKLIVVPVHGKAEVKRGLAVRIAKDAGVEL